MENATETPPSPLASFVRLARDPARGRAPAFAWHTFERDPVTWSYARTYRAAAAAAAKLWRAVRARGEEPPRLSPLQTSPEHRAHCVGVFVSEGPGFLLLILAVGLCGCAFVPLSKHDPPTRSAAAARAAAVSVIVVDDDDANVAHGVVEALETSTREGPRRSFGTDGNDADTLTEGDDAKRHEHVAYEKRNETRGDARRERVDVLRLSDVFDVGAFEDGEACGEDGGARRRGETPTGETHLASALADLDLDACLERHPERVSHVFFTSGSTGTPKGCVATRGALAWFAAGKRTTHGLDASSVALVASPHVFDPSLGDVYASLSAGGCVALCPEAKVVSELGACLLATNATHLTATPTALGSVETSAEASETENVFPSLRVVALGGEPTPRALAETWAGRVPVLANTYGVTECCVYQTFSRIDAGDAESRRRLGGGFPGVRAIHAAPPGDDPENVVDDDDDDDDDATGGDGTKQSRGVNLERVRESSSLAELWLAGPQGGLGYAGDPSLTEARFRTAAGPGGAAERLFRTGDITRRGAGGRVLVGRGDGQVKIRGRRVEPGEIESVMRECLCDVVRDVAVTATGKDGDGGSDGALVAWAVPRNRQRVFDVAKTRANVETGETTSAESPEEDEDDFQASTTPSAVTCDAMRHVLSSHFPEYMLPSRFAFVRALPRTASGKLARGELARRAAPPPPDRRDSVATRRGFPRGERALASIVTRAWSRELGVPARAIARASRFAELGGDSMVAARVCRGVFAATRAARAADAEDVGAHGEFLTGAFAPASLAGDVSLGTFVSRVAAELGRARDGTTRDGASETEDETEDENASFRETEDASGGIDDGSVSAGVSLLYRAAREDAPDVARALLRHGVPVDGWRDARGAPAVPGNDREGEGDGEGEGEIERRAPSPLHAACAAGAEAAAFVLLDRGAAPRAKARRGATPLHLAAAAAKPFSVEGLRCLLARADGGDARFFFGSVRRETGENPARGAKRRARSFFSAETETETKTKTKTKTKTGGALASRDDDRLSVLHYAARAGTSAANVEWLVDAAELLFVGAREPFAEWRDVWGRTAMHWAALNGHRGVVAALLRKGASPRAADARGETPAQLAERRALCSARDRPDGERASRWGDVATLLGGAGTTKHLKKSL